MVAAYTKSQIASADLAILSGGVTRESAQEVREIAGGLMFSEYRSRHLGEQDPLVGPDEVGRAMKSDQIMRRRVSGELDLDRPDLSAE